MPEEHVNGHSVGKKKPHREMAEPSWAVGSGSLEKPWQLEFIGGVPNTGKMQRETSLEIYRGSAHTCEKIT